MPEYTPGPWHVEEGAAYAGPPLVIAESGAIVGGFMGSGTKSVAEDTAADLVPKVTEASHD